MKYYSWNTCAITWTESPLQWNGCCLATNAKKEPNSTSTCFFFFFSSKRSVKHIPSHLQFHVFMCTGRVMTMQWGHPRCRCAMDLECQLVIDANFVHLVRLIQVSKINEREMVLSFHRFMCGNSILQWKEYETSDPKTSLNLAMSLMARGLGKVA